MSVFPQTTQVRQTDGPGNPGMIKALASVGLMLGLLGVALAPFMAMRLTGSSNSTNLGLQNPQGKWMLLIPALSVLLSILLLVAGVGCLKLEPWGRKLMIVYGVGALVVGLGGGYFYLQWLGVVGTAPAPQRGVIAWIELTGWILSLPYAVWALYAMLRPGARAAFRIG